MAQWDNYTTKSAPEDTDTLMLKDNTATGKPNKRLLFSGLWNWIVSKLTNAVINELTTTPQTVVGGMNSVKTALDTIGANYKNLGATTAIPSNSDLDNYTTPGSYSAQSNDIAATIAHAPTTRAFTLDVENALGLASSAWRRQILRASATPDEVYQRFTEGNAWSEWKKIPTMTDTSSALELSVKAVAPNNYVMYDDKGEPSIMVAIPKMKMSQLVDGGDNTVHPAFIVNGVEKDVIYISKYINCVKNERAYSLPAQPPSYWVTWDEARRYCEDKGDGWHMMTAAEYALIALLCMKNGFLPWGNNDHGKDTRESLYIGIPCSYENDGRTRHILTGTGPLKYSHNNAINGIFDLSGNLSEWVGGKRTVHGEIQLLTNNNAADRSNPQTATATTWMAIDATTGEFVTPNGSGTTPNSIKINVGSNNRPQWSNTVTTTGNNISCSFSDLTCDSTISTAAQKTLIAYLLLPASSTQDWENDIVAFNNVADERMFGAGGSFATGATAGIAANFGYYYARSSQSPNYGFRSAFVSL